MKKFSNSITNPTYWIFCLRKFSIVLVFLFINTLVHAHAVQGAWCFSPAGDHLRIYLEHWHHAFSSPPSGSTIDVTIIADGVTTKRTLDATGVINGVSLRNLPRHPSNPITILDKCNGDANN